MLFFMSYMSSHSSLFAHHFFRHVSFLLRACLVFFLIDVLLVGEEVLPVGRGRAACCRGSSACLGGSAAKIFLLLVDLLVHLLLH